MNSSDGRMNRDEREERTGAERGGRRPRILPAAGMIDSVRQEERAQAILHCLSSGPLTVRQIADIILLSPAETRVALDDLEGSGRVVKYQEINSATPLWISVERPA